jgi:FkbM family methyltransferase
VRILWHSVAPWVGSGYGQQTATFAPRIAALGHDVAISAYYGLMGAKFNWKGLPVYPAYAKSYGTDMIIPHAVHHFGGGEEGLSFRDVGDRGLIITLSDVWVLANITLLPEMNVASWVPIDHEQVPPGVSGWFQHNGSIPIAMSQFGRDALTDAGFEPLYVPHGIDTSIFRPGDKAEARARVGIPEDAFVVAMVAANVGKDGSRKAFYEQITAFGELHHRHPEAVLALHTDVTSPLGVDIRALLGDFPESAYLITDQYAYKVGVPAATVADIYRAADILTNTSWGEGFGIPLVEAQACGTPVVVTDTTAMPELCGAGWRVPGEPLWHDSQHAWARRPFIGGIVDAYEQAYAARQVEDRWLELQARAFTFAQDYDADRVLTEYWEPALKTLETAMERRAVDPGPPLRPVIREADGLLWYDRGPGYGDNLGWSGHEREIGPILESLLPEGGTFLDVGAHVGHWSIRLAEKAGYVYAVEPNPATLRILRKNIMINDVENVYPVEVAAWDSETRLTLTDPNDEISGGSTRTVEGPSDGVIQVEACPLDNVLAGGEIDLVKLDVEGADLHALRGMRNILAGDKPVLFIEAHDYAGYYTRQELIDTLADLGYEAEVAHTYLTRWQPDGVLDDPVTADYLVARPREDG